MGPAIFCVEKKKIDMYACRKKDYSVQICSQQKSKYDH